MHANHSAKFILLCAVGLLLTAAAGSGTKAGLHPSYSLRAQVDTVPFYPDAVYDPAVPTPNDYLSNPVGQWPNHFREIAGYLKVLAEESDRVTIETHEQTYEGRQLYNVFVSSADNIARLDEYRDAMSRIADPGATADEAELDALVEDQPAFAWLGYSIHGDEISGTDAAAQVAYHLAAADDSATLHLIDNVIIIIDPCENPDGRERFLSMLQTYKSHVPNYDRHSAQHSGIWPWGRGNHYWFDLNRDWILLRHPETRGRTSTIVKYNPVTVVDAHEMGSNATYLFTPPREPINYNTPENVLRWWEQFSADQAAAFDRHGWPYYIKEWHEQWYPGYGSAWPTFFGSVGILYEQAGVDGEFVRQQSDYILTYHESVNHQFTSSLANLFTTANNRVQLLTDYHNAREQIVEDGESSGLHFLFAPDEDDLKMKRFIESLVGQGIVVEKAKSAFAVSSATDVYHNEVSSKRYPEGTYIVNTAQPHGALAKTILEFDPHLKLEFLREERRWLEKHNETRMYEVSAWSVPLGYDLDAYYTTASVNVETDTVSSYRTASGNLLNPDARYAFIVDMEGEKTFRTLNEMFKQKLVVYAAEKPFTVDGYEFRAGALSIRKRGNPDDLVDRLRRIAEDIGIDIYGVNTGASSDGSYLGAPTFQLLREPRIAVLTGAPLSFNSAGANWFAIDYELQIPHSLIRVDELAFTDLSSYNVLVFPSAWGRGLRTAMGRGATSKLKEWMQDGGTLICMGSSAVWAADTSRGLTAVKLRRQALDDLSDYDRWVMREQRADAPPVDTMAIWHPQEADEEEEAEEATPGEKGPKMSQEELEDHDKWQRKFMPRGAIMRADVDTEHWLAFGMKEAVPVMLYTSHAFMSDDRVKTTARLADANNLRLGGLLWPEARSRWANTGYAMRDRSGKGQIILFAADPNMRAYFYGSRKMLINAILYGPGMGTRFDSPYD